ncbi:MAG: 3-hydroxyacyl-ACP dehydratase FabZ [Gammaproteobacteria bacterium]|nr:3-hydroxyacyl-ACP dehydratase FabZ [Gammaproteobacteria bacterium]
MLLDIQKIRRLLPHRYPILLIDRVLECVDGQSLVAVKNVTINEPFFSGHFPDRPIMPGVLILEALAQATALLAFSSGQIRSDPEALYYLVGIDKARFKKPVVPGDQLLLYVQLEREIRGIYRCDAIARVDGRPVATAKIMAVNR